MKERDNDPDETAGRALYRGQANALATLQANMADRKVKLKPAHPSPTLPNPRGKHERA